MSARVSPHVTLDQPRQGHHANEGVANGIVLMLARGPEPYNSDVEADVALSRCAPSGPRSLTPVVMASPLPVASWIHRIARAIRVVGDNAA
jgi:hypothetical protein